MNSHSAAVPPTDQVLADTRHWVDRAVIGLNLCPFAKAVQARGQVRYVVSDARTEEELLGVLAGELRLLADADPQDVETTLLIHPWVLRDFIAYNDFLDVADEAVRALGLEGLLQVASFHPEYQFADTEPDDIENCTNRSPYPTLHLLREDSINRAVSAMPDTDAIYRHNIETLRRLGPEGWAQWMAPRSL
ncbi:MAG TPA: DUF1415 domain-containing protein [Burkholderiaceae bacterium]|nr:DUF1415 domain-containing protein [Burkholderiaceae bacterium]